MGTGDQPINKIIEFIRFTFLITGSIQKEHQESEFFNYLLFNVTSAWPGKFWQIDTFVWTQYQVLVNVPLLKHITGINDTGDILGISELWQTSIHPIL